MYLFMIILGCSPVKNEHSAELPSEPGTVDEPEVAPEPSDDSASEPDNLPEEQDPFAQTDPLACQDYSAHDQLQPVLFPINETEAAQILINPAALNAEGETVGEQRLVELQGTEGWFVMQFQLDVCG